MKRKADLSVCEPGKCVRKAGARAKADTLAEARAKVGAKITHVSEEIGAKGPYAEAGAFLHFEAGKAGARVKVNSRRVTAPRSIVSDEVNSPDASARARAGRDRATRSIDSAEANSPYFSAMVEADKKEPGAMVGPESTFALADGDAEGGYAEPKPVNLKFGAGVRAKISAGRVRVKRTVVSANGSAMAVANTTEAEAMVGAEIASASVEIDAEGRNAEGDAYIHFEAKPGTVKFGAGARAKISAGRVRVKWTVVSANGSAMVVANNTEAEAMVGAEIASASAEIDTEGPYAEGDAYIDFEAKPQTVKFGAGVRAKVSEGRVRATCGSAEIDAEGAYAEGDAHIHFESNPRMLGFGAGVRAKVSEGRVRATCGSAEVDAEGPYAEGDAHIHFESNPGMLGFGGGVRAKASAGRVSARQDDISAEANGPNASAMIVANNREVVAMVGAEIASASLSAGPVGVKVGLGVETGAHIGPNGTEVKVLGCGLSVGSTMGVAVLGNELKFKLW